jgi:hypothetical protein
VSGARAGSHLLLQGSRPLPKDERRLASSLGASQLRRTPRCESCQTLAGRTCIQSVGSDWDPSGTVTCCSRSADEAGNQLSPHHSTFLDGPALQQLGGRAVGRCAHLESPGHSLMHAGGNGDGGYWVIPIFCSSGGA